VCVCVCVFTCTCTCVCSGSGMRGRGIAHSPGASRFACAVSVHNLYKICSKLFATAFPNKYTNVLNITHMSKTWLLPNTHICLHETGGSGNHWVWFVSALIPWSQVCRKSCHTSELTCHVNDSYEWSVSHVWTRHVTVSANAWPQVCSMPIYPYMYAHIHVQHDLVICVIGPIHMCDMTHSYGWHDSFIRVTRLIHTCDATHSHVWNGLSICVTWLFHTCDMTCSCVW